MAAVPSTLMLAGATQVIVAAAFFMVGNRLRRRPVAAESRAAALGFVGWWWGLAIYLAVQGILVLAAAAGAMPLWAHLANRLLSGPLLCAAVAGLAFHILFILTGRRWLAWPLAIYYGAAAVAYDALTILAKPTAVVAGEWQVDLVPRASSNQQLWDLVLASIGLPIILCSIAFILLATRVESREQRTRAVLVGSSMLIWVGSGLLAQLAGSNAIKFVTLVLFGLAAALLVFIAYYPPRPMRRWIAAGRHANSG